MPKPFQQCFSIGLSNFSIFIINVLAFRVLPSKQTVLRSSRSRITIPRLAVNLQAFFAPAPPPARLSPAPPYPEAAGSRHSKASPSSALTVIKARGFYSRPASPEAFRRLNARPEPREAIRSASRFSRLAFA